MTRYVKYAEIAAAVEGMPIVLSEDELIRVSRTSGPLKYIRLSGRRSPALWRVGDFQLWFARRYKYAPELVAELARRLNAPLTTDTNAKQRKAKARAS